jgi:hypothetical protein
MKHCIGKLEIQIAGHEITYSFKFKTELDPDEYLLMVCSDFFGEPDNPESDHGFSFDGGSVWISPYDYQEIDGKTWESLTILNNINLKNVAPA